MVFLVVLLVSDYIVQIFTKNILLDLYQIKSGVQLFYSSFHLGLDLENLHILLLKYTCINPLKCLFGTYTSAYVTLLQGNFTI